MGLTIHYQGQFRRRASLPAFIAEVKDIAETLGWTHHVFDAEFPPQRDDTVHDGKLYGMLVNAPGCEPLHLSFLSNRRMCSVGGLQLWGTPDTDHPELLYKLFSKTQFGGPDVHIAIINLTRYLSKKYLTRFKLIDESQYWETGDEPFMRKQFAFLDAAIRDMSDAFQSQAMKDGESWEEYTLRMATKVKRDLG